MKLKVLVVGVVVALFVLASTAEAQTFSPTDEDDYAAALAYWGVSAPPQCTVVAKQIVPGVIDNDGIISWGDATQPAPGFLGPCELNISSEVEPCALQTIFDHEVGHLLGLGHSLDPDSVMYAPPKYPICEAELASRLAAEIGVYGKEFRAEVRAGRRAELHRRWQRRHVVRRASL